MLISGSVVLGTCNTGSVALGNCGEGSAPSSGTTVYVPFADLTRKSEPSFSVL